MRTKSLLTILLVISVIATTVVITKMKSDVLCQKSNSTTQLEGTVSDLQEKNKQLQDKLYAWSRNTPTSYNHASIQYSPSNLGLTCELCQGKDVSIDTVTQRERDVIARTITLNEVNQVGRITLSVQEFPSLTEKEVLSTFPYDCYEGSCSSDPFSLIFATADSKKKIMNGVTAHYFEHEPFFYDLSIAKLVFLTTSPYTNHPMVVRISVNDTESSNMNPGSTNNFSAAMKTKAIAELLQFANTLRLDPK